MNLKGVIPLEKLEEEGRYCIRCFNDGVQKITKKGRLYYQCPTCGTTSERRIVIDNGITWWIDAEGTYWHESVGVIVLNEKSKILCLMRKIYPFALGLPAGHLDRGEEPLNAARRELKEETGLSPASDVHHIATFDMPGDSCSRGSDHHRWHLYRTHSHNAHVPSLSDEASEAQWLTIAEIQKHGQVTYALRYIINNFGLSLLGPL